MPKFAAINENDLQIFLDDVRKMEMMFGCESLLVGLSDGKRFAFRKYIFNLRFINFNNRIALEVEFMARGTGWESQGDLHLPVFMI